MNPRSRIETGVPHFGTRHTHPSPAPGTRSS
jgi:hypothetical protein